MSILSDASDDLVQGRGIDLATACAMAEDAYQRRNKVGDARYLDHQRDWRAREQQMRQGLR
jgi:hypothetical protein